MWNGVKQLLELIIRGLDFLARFELRVVDADLF